jgi:hypothetical protein
MRQIVRVSGRIIVALGIGVCALMKVATVEEVSIPSFRANKAAISQYWQLLQLDIIRPRFVGLPVSEVVNKIVVDVHGPHLVVSGDYAATRVVSARLDGYALRVMQSRLQELGVATWSRWDSSIASGSGARPAAKSA